MLGSIVKKIFGTDNDRKVKKAMKIVAAVNALEEEYSALSDDQVRAKTTEFKARVEQGESLDDLMPEAFANVREGAKRALGMRHFDVQLLGGAILHQGKIAEMKTGEGKTLVATLPVYLNALSGKGAHVVTVNDYLAKRDSDWMAQVYNFLGLTCGVVVPGLDDDQRRAAYACDVTYATNNELGFDYLRDNLKYTLESMVQRPHNYAIVDEVDSILIDEARTPLVISGPTEDLSDQYKVIDTVIPHLLPEHYEIDEKQRTALLTEEGNEFVEKLLKDQDMMKSPSLYDPENISLVHHVNQALRAHKLFARDKDYIVRDGQVVIIDEFTGRMMAGRRFGDGLHQALEAKEAQPIQSENQTIASITFQNYFRLYDKLAGMTGTALTEADEFMEIYGLDVLEIPTNRPITREDDDDQVYRTTAEKNAAVIEHIIAGRKRGQPMLVGTTSIEKSEQLSEALTEQNISHEVLNARHHEQEAQIIALAGLPGAVTIATNMAGRGTDIQLGGNFDVRMSQEADGPDDEAAASRIRAEIEDAKKKAIEAGGLWVLATERHESRRIDNQLRGRSGRQGDPGKSSFYLSLEDDLMRIFGSERMDSMLQKLGLKEGESIVHSWVNKAIEKAQTKVEARNFDIRKNLLKYDDVMNDQRKAIFEQRLDVMAADDLSDDIADMRESLIDDLVARYVPAKAYAEQWDVESLDTELKSYFGMEFPVKEWASEEGVDDETIRERLYEAAEHHAAKRAAEVGSDLMRQIEKHVIIQTVDQHWREHLSTLDHLKSVVGLRGYAQRDPLNEYKSDAFGLFESMMSSLRGDVTRQMMHVRVTVQPPEPENIPSADLHESHLDPTTGENEASGTTPYDSPEAAEKKPEVKLDPNNPQTWGKVGRNESCPCGSGKKYKQCHGKV